MYCNKCGSKLPDNSAFCMSCGAKLKDLNREKPEEEQKSTVESVQEPVEKEIEQNIPPITQMRSDVMTAEQASAEIVQLGQVLEQAVKEKQAEKDTKWVRIRVDKNARIKLKRSAIASSVGLILSLGMALVCFILSTMNSELTGIMLIYAGLMLVLVALCSFYMILYIRLLNGMNISDFYVSNIRCYGIDTHAETVSFLLNDIVGIKRVKWSKYTKRLIDCGFLSLCTDGGEYIFASRDIDIVFATFSKYLSEREKNR